VDAISAELTEKLNALDQLAAEKTPEAHREFVNAFETKLKNKTVGPYAMLDMTSMGIMGFAALNFAKESISNGVLFTQYGVGVGVVSVLAADWIYRQNDKRREKALRAILDQYFGQKQYELTTAFLNEKLRPLRASLAPHFDARADALERIKAELKRNNPDLDIPVEADIDYDTIDAATSEISSWRARVLKRFQPIVAKFKR
jgi:hypothetical protein